MTALVVLVVVVALGLWVRSFTTHPFVVCPKCKGSKEITHPLFRSARGPCPTCGGTGRVRRTRGRGPLD